MGSGVGRDIDALTGILVSLEGILVRVESQEVVDSVDGRTWIRMTYWDGVSIACPLHGSYRGTADDLKTLKCWRCGRNVAAVLTVAVFPEGCIWVEDERCEPDVEKVGVEGIRMAEGHVQQV